MSDRESREDDACQDRFYDAMQAVHENHLSEHEGCPFCEETLVLRRCGACGMELVQLPSGVWDYEEERYRGTGCDATWPQGLAHPLVTDGFGTEVCVRTATPSETIAAVAAGRQ